MLKKLLITFGIVALSLSFIQQTVSAATIPWTSTSTATNWASLNSVMGVQQTAVAQNYIATSTTATNSFAGPMTGTTANFNSTMTIGGVVKVGTTNFSSGVDVTLGQGSIPVSNPSQLQLNSLYTSFGSLVGYPLLGGNWFSNGVWGIGPATQTSDNTLRLGYSSVGSSFDQPFDPDQTAMLVAIASSTYGQNATIRGTASSTNDIVSSLGKPSGTFVAADPTGKLIATTTPSGGSSFAYPFDRLTNYGTTSAATTTQIWAQNGLNASSTSHFVNASSTSLSSASIYDTSLGQGWLYTLGGVNNAILSSTSPTIAYLTSTSTATSSFQGLITTATDYKIGLGGTTDLNGGYSMQDSTGLKLSFLPSQYNGCNGFGLDNKNGHDTSTGFNGFLMENCRDFGSSRGLVDFAWAALAPSGGSILKSVRLEVRSGFVKTPCVIGTIPNSELQFGSTNIYIGGFGNQPNLFLGSCFSAVTTGLSIGQGMSPTAPPTNGLFVQSNIQTNGSVIATGAVIANGNVQSSSTIMGYQLGIGTTTPIISAEIAPIHRSNTVVNSYTDSPFSTTFSTSHTPIDVGSVSGTYEDSACSFGTDTFSDNGDGTLGSNCDGHIVANINYTTGAVDSSPYLNEQIDTISYTITVTTNWIDSTALQVDADIIALGTTTASKFVKTGGTGTQFLMADGTTAASSTIYTSTGSKLSVATTTATGVLNLGKNIGTTNSSSTVFMSKVQFDGYNSAGVRTCTFLNASNVMTTINGACIN